MEVVMGMEEEAFVAPSLAPSPISSPKKMRRLRKVRIPSEDDSAMATASSQADEVVSLQENTSEGITITAPSSGVIRESAEEILRRFGKEDRAVGDNSASLVDVGKKRKAVQSTIRAAVVDMAMETLKVIQGSQASEEQGGLTTPNVDSAEVDLELASHQEQGDDICQDFPAPNRKKRSISMRRCSLTATSLTVAVDFKEDQASAEENAMVDEEGGSESPTETGSKDGDNKEVAENEGAWNAGWSDDLGGEAESMEAILERARKLVSDLSNENGASAETTNEKKRSSDGDSIENDAPSGKKKKGKKEQERTREDMYAESQRLLRESKGVAFVAAEPIMKPVSSVLEKIRQRRLQLGCSQGGSSLHSVENKPRLSQATIDKSLTHVDLTIDEDTEVEIEVFNSNLDKTEKVGPETIPLPAAEVEERLDEYADGTPGTPENQTESARIELVSSRTSSQDSKTMVDQSQLCTQDLFCNSQLSPGTDDSPKATPFDRQVAGISDLMGLDTEIQDEAVLLRTPSEELNKGNRDTSVRLPAPFEVYTTATHVRGLIDDEAEDEDEDILADNAEEEEVGDGYEDLQDLIAGPQEEKAGDRARRAALHRKWLDQQDTEQTDDILERLRTGRSSRWKGRDRVVSCLDDDDDFPNDGPCEVVGNNDDGDLNEQAREESCSAEVHAEEASLSFRERARKLKQLPDHMVNAIEDNVREDPVIEDELVEDEEEHEKAVLRKMLLEQSKEQFSLMSAAEDESSREVFGLIKRVNVAPPKSKPTTGRSELRNISSLPSALPSETISFLGRNSSSSLPPPGRMKCNSGGSRSFIFSRDDSNSNHGFPSSNQFNGDKETELTKSGSSERETKSTRVPASAQPQPQAKKTKPSASSNGPSLFDLLRKQASEVEQAILKPASAAAAKNWGNDAEAFSVFAPKSFTLSKRKS